MTRSDRELVGWALVVSALFAMTLAALVNARLGIAVLAVVVVIAGLFLAYTPEPEREPGPPPYDWETDE